MSLSLQYQILGNRYLNDGQPVVSNTVNQKKVLRTIGKDARLTRSSISACPLCHFRQAYLIAQKERDGIFLQTAICTNCGLVFSTNPLDNHGATRYYSHYYRSHHEDDKKKKIIPENIESKYQAQARNRIPAFLSKDSIVVEIGCGGGWNLFPFAQKGIAHFGFDYDRDYLSYGKTKGINLFRGSVDEAIKKGIKADYLMLIHVLEHTSDPIHFLHQIKRILKKNAILNIYVPSMNVFFWGGGGSGYDLLRSLQIAHNFLFDSFTLQQVAQRAGFEVILNHQGTNIVLKNSGRVLPSYNLSLIGRGKLVLLRWRIIELMVPIKKWLAWSDSIWYYLFLLAHPINLAKKIYYFRFAKKL